MADKLLVESLYCCGEAWLVIHHVTPAEEYDWFILNTIVVDTMNVQECIIVSQPNLQKARFQSSSIGQFQSSILCCPTTDLKFTVYKSFVDINLSTDSVQQRESVPYTVVPYQTHQLRWKTV